MMSSIEVSNLVAQILSDKALVRKIGKALARDRSFARAMAEALKSADKT